MTYTRTDHAGPPGRTGRFLLLATLLLAAVAAFLVIAARVFQPTQRIQSNVGDIVRAEVVAVVSEDHQAKTQVLDVRMQEGPRAGQRSLATQQVISFEDNVGRFAPGDTIYVLLDPNAPPAAPLFVVDFVRSGWLALFALILAAATVLTARWQGVGALVGLATSFAVLAVYVVPAILTGQNPVLTAVVGAVLILLVTLFLAHGFNLKTTVALVGTGLSLALTGILSTGAVALSRLTGLSNDEAAILFAQTGDSVSVTGLLLAGMIIGAIGVLNDASVTQASAVFELRASAPRTSWSELYRRGMRVGRDHIASSIYTLALAYAGAALPLFLLLAISTEPLGVTINREFIAEELVRAIVGTLGLLACVPLTTLLAALALTARPR